MDTKTNFSKGLQDVVAGQSTISAIDGQKSLLSYRGYDIHDLCMNATFEETAFLLLNGHLPTQGELTSFAEAIAKERELPQPVQKFMQTIPKQANPMAVLRTAVSYLSVFDKDAESKDIAKRRNSIIKLMAKIPTIVAVFDRIRSGESIVAPKLDAQVGLAANFLYMRRGKDASDIEARVLDRYLILLAEHDYNASTFTARVTASTLSDVYSAMSAGIGTLKGDLHGSANTRAMESLLEIGDINQVEPYVNKMLGAKRKLMGFGHRVYKGPDPRAKDLRQMAKDLAEANAEQAKWFAISEKLEKLVWERKKLYCNVDFYSASVLYTIGIPVDLFTTLFAMSRTAGWSAHVLAQCEDNRLIRPVSEYVGEKDLKYVPIAERH